MHLILIQAWVAGKKEIEKFEGGFNSERCILYRLGFGEKKEKFK